MLILPGGAPTPPPRRAWGPTHAGAVSRDRSLGAVTHYEALGVRVSATAEEIRRAYLRQARLHHPDVGGGDRAMQALNEAWAVLGDPARRARYDRTLGVTPSPPPFVAGPQPGECLFLGDEPEPVVPRDLRREILLLLPVAVLGLAVACFAFSLVLSSVALQIAAVLLVPVAAVCFVMVPVLTLRQQARRAYRGQ